MTSSVPHTPSRFPSAVRAFLAEARFGGVTPASWHELAHLVICADPDHPDDLLLSALRALSEKRPTEQDIQPLPADLSAAFSASLHRFNGPEHDPELGQLWRALYTAFPVDIDLATPVATLKKRGIEKSSTDSGNQVASSVIVVDDADDDDIVQVSVTQHPVKRPRHTASLPPQSSKKGTKQSSKPIVEKTCPAAHGKQQAKVTGDDGSSTAPVFGFHLLKTEGLSCGGNAYVSLQDMIHGGGSLAVVCNFQIDMQWFWHHAPAIETFEKILIIHGSSFEDEQNWREYLRSRSIVNNVHFLRPMLPNFGTMHSKLFALFYRGLGCRVCVHSANLIEQDWTYKTQAAYMRDFPVKRTDTINEAKSDASTGGANEFQAQLSDYLRYSIQNSNSTQSVKNDSWLETVTREIQQIDFTSAGASIVTSVPGKHSSQAKHKYGHFRLRSILAKERIVLRKQKHQAVVCQFSSLGSIQEKWLLDEFNVSLSASNSTSDKTPIQLVYPTVQQVANSNEGLSAGMSIPVRNSNMNRPHILNRLFKWDASISNRQCAMPHMKSFIHYQHSTSTDKTNKSDDLEINWIMIGSFNLSVAAWGKLESKGTFKILSYEFGIVLTPALWRNPTFALPQAIVKYTISHDNRTHKQDKPASFKAYLFEKARSAVVDIDTETTTVFMPVPFQLPPTKYNRDDVPWTLEKFQELAFMK